MKQTNGAILLLQNAFKGLALRSYLKGIASAVVLTAGLSAGAANAADPVNINSKLASSVAEADGIAITVNNGDSFSFSAQAVPGYNYAGFAESVTVSNGGVLTGTGHLGLTDSLKLAQGGTINLSNGAVIGRIAADTELYPDVELNGTVKLTNGGIQGNDLTVGSTADILIEGKYTGDNVTAGTAQEFSQLGGGYIHPNNGQTVGETNIFGKITIGDYGQVLAYDNTVMNINNGAVISFKGTQSKSGIEGAQGSTVNINGGLIQTADPDDKNKDKITGAIHAVNLNIKGGQIVVTEGNTFEIDGFISSSKQYDATAQREKLTAVMTGGEIINDGTLNIAAKSSASGSTFTATGGTITNRGNMTFSVGVDLSGATVTNTKTMTVNGDLSVDALSDLYNNATKADEKASLTVSGNVTVTGADEFSLVSGYGFTNSATANSDTTLEALDSTVTIDSTYNTKFDIIKADEVIAATADASKGTFSIVSGSTVSAVSGFDLSTADASGDKSLTVAGTFNLGEGFTGTGSLGGENGLNIDVNEATAGNAIFTISSGEWNLESLTLTSGNATVSAGASLTTEQLNVTTNTGKALTVNGTLTLTGDDVTGKDETVADVQVKGNVNVNEGGRLVITGADAINDVVTVNAPATGTTYNTATVNSTNWTSGGVTVKGGGVLELQLGSDVVFQNAAAVETLKDQLWAATSKGILNIGDASYGLKDNGDGSYNYEDLAEGVSTSATADAVINVSVASGAAGIAANEYGSVYVNDSKEATATTDIKLAGGTIFNKSNDKNSFASSAKTEVLNLEITSDDGAVVFNGAGEIGSLTQSAGVSGAVLFQAGAGTQTVGAITLHKATVGTGAVVSDDNVDVTEFVLNAGTSYNNYDDSGVPRDSNEISVGKLTAAGEIATNTLTIKAASANSTSEASANIFAENFEIEASTGAFTNKFTVSNGATLTADTVTLGSGASVILGTDGDDSSAGYADMGKLVMGAGSNIVIDPEYGENVGLAVAESIVDTADAAVDNPDMKLSGNLLVGQNSAFGLGFETVDELRAAIGEYLTNGSLSRDDVGAIAYLNKSLALGNGTNSGNIYLDADGTNSTLGSHSFTTSGSVTLGANTALIIGDTVDLTDEAAITDVTSVSGATGSKVIIKGVYSVKDTLQLIDGKAGSSVTDAGLLSTIEVGEGGLLVGDAQTAAGGNGIDIKLTKAEDFDEKLYNVSSPVNALYNHVYDGNYSSDAAGVEYIYGVGGHDGGKSVEATSRLGVYGGAVQAAYMAQQTSTDAVADRLGMASSNSALVYADNAQGGGLWLMPVYRSMDSEDFAAQGVDYGTDIDLYGVALGADFTTDSGVRVGGYFNVGSGDADGQQVASEVSNDFDYYGVGIYAGMTFGQFGLIADMGFTQVSNDLEQNAYYAGKLTADADSSAVTAGLRAEYAFELAAVDVVPHLGVRYTRLDMDSYDVTGADGVYASTSSDSMSVFSIPFGVSVSTDIEAGNWSVKPVLDLTLTANTGDDELDSDTTFTGAGMTSALSTEVLDSFTYGGTVGVQAKYGESLSLGVGLNYTGSDNTDAFGVTGDIRYMF